ncbi:MAG: ABC transporter permease subunit [Phycisphaerales bacterium]|nr:MAG: ABC transporter permease subunit [Phycisphaerales bacterium]
MQLWALVCDSFRYALDRKIFWVLVAITALVVLFMLCVGFEEDRISLVFGLWEVNTEGYNPLASIGQTRIIGMMVYYISDVFLGWIGITLMIIATAGVFPCMMEPGAVDVLLGKPIHRLRLFLYKYVAGMVFVLLQATLFVGATFLVMGFRWHVWAPGYLVCIPLMVLLFSYLFCVSVLVGVYTRSSVAAILVSLAAWVAFALVSQAPALFTVFPELQQHRRIHKTVRIIGYLPPKTADIPFLAAKCAGGGTSIDTVPESVIDSGPHTDRESINRSRQWEEEQIRMSLWKSIGSSLLFEAFIVLLAMRKFSRQDF